MIGALRRYVTSHFGAAAAGRSRRLAKKRAPSSSAEAIEALYGELRELMEQASTGADVEEEIDQRFSRLRELQAIEADAIQRRYEMSRRLDPERGWRALERAREILGDEDPAAVHEPARP